MVQGFEVYGPGVDELSVSIGPYCRVKWKMKWYQGMQESVNSRIRSLFVVLARFISQFGSDGSMEEIFEWLCDSRLELVNEIGKAHVTLNPKPLNLKPDIQVQEVESTIKELGRTHVRQVCS